MKSNFDRNKIKDFKSILCINLSHLFSYSIHDPIVLKGVTNGHKNVTGFLIRSPLMLPPFFVFQNFAPNWRGGSSGSESHILIARLPHL